MFERFYEYLLFVEVISTLEHGKKFEDLPDLPFQDKRCSFKADVNETVIDVFAD
ncbi:MAG: hypothetical protein HUJ74_01900 [Lachnospiraceae bacterium]|nr:hypothetical protein [Lachnospiraceae bacterium]